ncbi:MAG TPA: Holliday junction branch migration protein RuvA [Myxococcota bacterium]|jgi:Holliday junction DNA helicase RuvA|nr:Holliday junction branch migration protein RuvA [Myxococcota bacterium]
MIASLEGVLREKTPQRVVIDVAGVGYEVLVPLSTFTELPQEGKTVALRIHTHVREDAIQLYGFASARERALFELLIRASGVGPRLAQGILSGMEPARLLEALAEGDVAALRSVPGLGQKKAERLVVELRERASELRLAHAAPAARPAGGAAIARGPADAGTEEALSALLNLGYAKPQAQRVIDEARSEAGAEASVEALLRSALRRLSR